MVGYAPLFRVGTPRSFSVSTLCFYADLDTGWIVIKTVEKNLVDIPLVAPFEREGSSSLSG